MVFGVLSCFEQKLSLAELRSATSGFEAVFLTLFHSRVTCQVTSLLQDRTVVRVSLEQSSRDAVTDGSCLSGVAAAAYVYQNVELVSCLGRCQGLAHDNLQGLKSEILIDVSLLIVTFPVPGTRYTLAIDFFLLPVP